MRAIRLIWMVYIGGGVGACMGLGIGLLLGCMGLMGWGVIPWMVGGGALVVMVLVGIAALFGDRIDRI